MSAKDKAFLLDKQTVRAAFERASHHCDSAARVQRELGERLMEHLDPVHLAPARILDLGAGTGELAKALSRRYRHSRILALDLVEGMMRVARGKTRRFLSRQDFACGDAEGLPLAAERIDLVISNCALQWCNDPDRVFAEVLRVLKPGGLFMFSTLGPDSLRELRQSFAQVDDRPHVHGFIDMHDLGDALMRAGFADVVMDTVRLVAEYDNVAALTRELKTLGATNALSTRCRGLSGRGRMNRLVDAYEAYRRGGVLPATFEAVFAHAWKTKSSSKAGVSVAPPRL